MLIHIASTLSLLVLLSSCSWVSEEVERGFVQINDKLVEIVNKLETENQQLFDNINNNASSSQEVSRWREENSTLIFHAIEEQNKKIDSVIRLIVTNAKSESDPNVGAYFLVTKDYAKWLVQTTEQTYSQIKEDANNFQLDQETEGMFLKQNEAIKHDGGLDNWIRVFL